MSGRLKLTVVSLGFIPTESPGRGVQPRVELGPLTWSPWGRCPAGEEEEDPAEAANFIEVDSYPWAC